MLRFPTPARATTLGGSSLSGRAGHVRRPTTARGLALSCALAGAAACSGAAEPAPTPWRPGTTLATPRAPSARGLLDRRGLVHAHSVYSHDACDNEPVKNGERDPLCFDDFRRGVCQSKHDFVMLTDHDDAFEETEFPDSLLYRPARGDVLVERGGDPVASWAACEDGTRALIMSGMEAGVMPVGLERHLLPRGERGYYGDTSSTAIMRHKEAGAVVLVAHTEEWTPEQLVELPLDGFEMYNLHANTFVGIGTALELLFLVNEKKPGLPVPDLAIVPLWSEDPRYIETWGSVLARGKRAVTTMGTDCHRNTFPALLEDGERVDSYRRMMNAFSNHLLVRPEADGTWDDRHLKAALKSGRVYGVFEMLGYPQGFDVYAEAGGRTYELGEGVPLGGAPRIIVRRPVLIGLDPARKAPLLTVRLLRAREGGFDEVASSTEGDLSFTPTQPGAYRAEVRMVPHHLTEDLGMFAARSVTDRAWIYANSIYVE